MLINKHLECFWCGEYMIFPYHRNKKQIQRFSEKRGWLFNDKWSFCGKECYENYKKDLTIQDINNANNN